MMDKKKESEQRKEGEKAKEGIEKENKNGFWMKKKTGRDGERRKTAREREREREKKIDHE